MNLQTFRKEWNKQHKELRQLLTSGEHHNNVIQLFLKHHAQLHAASITIPPHYSYADAILNDIPEAKVRQIPQNEKHSVVWLLWHMARVEDVTMNVLVAGDTQILYQNDWLARINVQIHDTGNGLKTAEITKLSATVDFAALRAYRLAVGRKTQTIAKQLTAVMLKQKVDPVRLQTVRVEEEVVAEASGIIDYWSRRDIAGLLLMPATRHNMVHLNEMLRIKQRHD